MAIEQYAAAVLADNPWVFYKFDDLSGLPQDSSGNGRHITSIDVGAGLTYREPGPFTGAFGIKSSNSSQMNRSGPPNAVNNFGVEMWILMYDPPDTDGSQIFNCGNVGSGFQIHVDTDLKFKAQINGATVLTKSTATLSAAVSTQIGIFREAGTWVYYVNGAVDTANAGNTVPGDPSAQGFNWNQDLAATYGSTISCGSYYTSAIGASRVAAHFAAGTQSPSEVGQYVTHRVGRGAGW